MALGDEDVAVGCDDDAGRLGQGLRRIPGHTGRADREQHLALRAELDHRVALRLFSRMLLALALVRTSCIDHPDVAFPIDIDLVRKDEHVGAEALQHVAGRIELEHRRHGGPGAGVVRERRASRRNLRIGAAARRHPDRFAIVVDGDRVERAPRSSVGKLAPRRDGLVGIGKVVGRRDIARRAGTGE